jgi:serine/threonine protein kinase/lipopolysaccharide biosynthesis regulator YciM
LNPPSPASFAAEENVLAQETFVAPIGGGDGPAAKPIDAKAVNRPANLTPGPSKDSHATAEAAKALGPYEVGSEIGRGGMGLVLRAYDQALKRDVAIKTLHPQARADEIKRKRFIKEAQITGQLEHPGIVPVHYFGWDEAGNEFFSMKLASGLPLDKILSRWHNGDAETLSQFPLTRLLSVFERICETVGFAHSRGVMHRDLKPGNIMIGTHGEVWVLDWGLAKLIGETREADVSAEGPRVNTRIQADASFNTMDGLVVGTPEYMAPEQAAGEKLDEGVDIYALGALLYAILTSQAPRNGKSVQEVISKAAQGHFVPVRRTIKGKKVPVALAAITQKCLRPYREQRYGSVDELLADLRNYAAGREVSALPESFFDRALRSARRHRDWLALGICVAALLLVTVTVAAVLVAKKDREAKHGQEQAYQAVLEQQKAEADKQAALAAGAEKSQRRLKAFKPYAQAMDLLMRDQLPAQAVALLSEALQIDPEFMEAQYSLADAYRMAGNPAKAGETYLKADELSVRLGGQHNLQALVSAGFTYDGAGLYDKAEDCFNSAVKHGADDPLAKVGRCFTALYRQDFADARKQAEDALKAGAHLWECHFATGYVLLESAQEGLVPPAPARKAAAAAFVKALELSPRQAETCVWLGNAIFSSERTPESMAKAKSFFDRAVELEPLNGNRRVNRAFYFLSIGDQRSVDAEIAEARRLGMWEVQFAVFNSMKASREGDLETAFRELGHAMHASREWPPHVANWLNIGFALKKDAECLPVMERWAQKNPNYCQVYATKGGVLARKGDFQGAIAEFKKGLELAPYNLPMLNALATSHTHLRQFNEALAVAEKVLAHFPDNEQIRITKAHALIGLKRHDAAMELLSVLEKSTTATIKAEAQKLHAAADTLRKQK